MSISILKEAHQLVFGQRGDDYGAPSSDFGRTAKIWSAILGTPVNAEQVGLCMIGVKLSRQVNRPKRDNLVDIAGYAQTIDLVLQRELEEVDTFDAGYGYADDTADGKYPYDDGADEALEVDREADYPGLRECYELYAQVAPDQPQVSYDLYVTDPDGDKWKHVGDGLYTWLSQPSTGLLALAPTLRSKTPEYIRTGGYKS